MILADAFTDMPKEFAEWLACLAFAVMFINQAMKLVKSFRGKPGHPPNDELDRRLTKLEEIIVGKEWFDDVNRDIRELKDGQEQRRLEMETSFNEVRETMRTMPMEIVALLRNTKNLI